MDIVGSKVGGQSSTRPDSAVGARTNVSPGSFHRRSCHEPHCCLCRTGSRAHGPTARPTFRDHQAQTRTMQVKAVVPFSLVRLYPPCSTAAAPSCLPAAAAARRSSGMQVNRPPPANNQTFRQMCAHRSTPAPLHPPAPWRLQPGAPTAYVGGCSSGLTSAQMSHLRNPPHSMMA